VPADARPHRLTHEEYFALEQAEDQRYEYLAGAVFAMAGGSELHALIGANTLVSLFNALRDRPCRVYGADMKVYVAAFDKFCYPDVQVLCGEAGRRERFLEGPVLIVEVLSDTTESYDRGLKFEHYRGIPELHQYLLLNQDRAHAEIFSRREDGVWELREATGLEAEVRLTALDTALPMAELYRNVELPAAGA
jgi:Uma2 family endonuclease